MKEYTCKKEFYINGKKVASVGDSIATLPDGSVVNKSDNQNRFYYPNIDKDKEYFINISNKNNFHPVNRPKHYTNSNIECIDAMIAAFGKEAVMTFCKLNAFKYLWREKNKNGLQDVDKAGWYTNKYLELAEK